MKKISFLIAIFISILTFSQKNQYLEVNYTTKVDMDIATVLEQIPAQYRSMVKNQIEQELKKGIYIDYILKTNGNESTYKIVEQISNAQDQAGIIAQQIKQFDKGTLYKNISKNEFRKPIELPGVNYLLKDTLSNLNWKITREKANIAGFETRKATGILVQNGEKIDIEAWYAPKISVKDGPGNLWGLPGLILKTKFSMNKADLTITANKINVKGEEIEIEIPQGGKEVNQEELNTEIKAMQEKFKEMMSNGVDTE